ncbi:hypothetical protein ACLQ18_32020 [Streptomyces sp. DT193]|uniref:hypothetical protein n=1 Tax=Streptomyces sp. DT193 TaxID=3393418 RepID=UPI003CF7F01B
MNRFTAVKVGAGEVVVNKCGGIFRKSAMLIRVIKRIGWFACSNIERFQLIGEDG